MSVFVALGGVGRGPVFWGLFVLVASDIGGRSAIYEKYVMSLVGSGWMKLRSLHFGCFQFVSVFIALKGHSF